MKKTWGKTPVLKQMRSHSTELKTTSRSHNQQPDSEKTLPGRPPATRREETLTSLPSEPSASHPEPASEPAIPPCPSPSPPRPMRTNPSRRIASLLLHARRNEPSRHAFHRPQPSQHSQIGRASCRERV